MRDFELLGDIRYSHVTTTSLLTSDKSKFSCGSSMFCKDWRSACSGSDLDTKASFASLSFVSEASLRLLSASASARVSSPRRSQAGDSSVRFCIPNPVTHARTLWWIPKNATPRLVSFLKYSSVPLFISSLRPRISPCLIRLGCSLAGTKCSSGLPTSTAECGKGGKVALSSTISVSSSPDSAFAFRLRTKYPTRADPFLCSRSHVVWYPQATANNFFFCALWLDSLGLYELLAAPMQFEPDPQIQTSPLSSSAAVWEYIDTSTTCLPFKLATGAGVLTVWVLPKLDVVPR